jgi:hypothetical protein
VNIFRMGDLLYRGTFIRPYRYVSPTGNRPLRA